MTFSMCIDNTSRFFFLQFSDYKGNSSPSKPIRLESVQGNTDAEQARAKGNRNTSTKVTKNADTTRSHVKSPDETDEYPYEDAILRIGKV